MNFKYKNFRYTIMRWTGIVALMSSAFLFSCGGTEGNGADGQIDANEGAGVRAGNDDDPADTLTVGGASNGRPPGYGAMQDTVQTPGVNLDSIRASQTGSNAVHSGTNSAEVNSSLNNNGRNSALSDSVNRNTNSNTGETLDSRSGSIKIDKNINPTNKAAKPNADGNK